MSATMIVTLGIVLAVMTTVSSLPEQGVWDINVTEGSIKAFTKSMYNNSWISVKIDCSSDTDLNLTVTWLLRVTPCAEEYLKVHEEEDLRNAYMSTPSGDPYRLNYHLVHYKKSDPEIIRCNYGPHSLFDLSSKRVQAVTVKQMVSQPVNQTGQAPAATPQERQRRDADPVQPASNTVLIGDRSNKTGNLAPESSTQSNTSPKTTKQAQNMVPEKHDENDLHAVTNTWEDGIYLFLLEFDPGTLEKSTFNAEVTVRMKGPRGYLSAIEWPLLPFYGTMCVVYVLMAVVWLVLSACNWRDLLRIQFWIGAVILLGMLEKAVFFGEYSSINITGRSVRGAVVFAEVVSCLKRTLARMLVVIVSLGFGIVKPRLGPLLHRVLGMGALYFILGSVEGCLRVLRAKSDVSSQALLANIPLAILDAAICWWVFTSLVQTTRTLRLRRNLVKLGLYRHFTNTLIFAVLASVAFMIWSLKQHKLTTCLTDWKEIWVDDAFWHLLFSILLLVIMVLWRPNNNNQRYAFSPLLDAAEDEEAEEPMMNDAFEGMKMRGSSTQRAASPKPKEVKNKPEDDLKWIEENIPTSVTDTALPSLLDSDEEIMTTKFEISKME